MERLVLYHINEDNNVQAKLSASQYGFRAGVSMETALHEFVRCVEHSLVRKKPALGIFLDIVGAFDNVTFRSFVAALRGLGMSKILTTWIETLLRHRTVQVELYGDKVERGRSKGRRLARNSQWGGCFGGLGAGPQPLEANGGLGAKAPAVEG